MRSVALIAVMAVAFVAGCGGDGEKPDVASDDPIDVPKTSGTAAASADKSAVPASRIAALEKEVAKIKTEVQQLRHRIETDAKMRSRRNMLPYPRQPSFGGADDFSDGEFRPRRFPRRDGSDVMRDDPAAERQDPATMTPEQRRVWHEERRKLREEKRQKMLEKRKREKSSESKNQKPTEEQTTTKKEETK